MAGKRKDKPASIATPAAPVTVVVDLPAHLADRSFNHSNMDELLPKIMDAIRAGRVAVRITRPHEHAGLALAVGQVAHVSAFDARLIVEHMGTGEYV